MMASPEGAAMCEVTALDCRFPYEYDGGHVKGAINVFTCRDLKEFWRNSRTRCVEGKQLIILMYCEFSKARSPRMLDCLQTMIDKDDVPVKPELKLLRGGYKRHYDKMKRAEKREELGGAKGYTPMKSPSPDLDVDWLESRLDTAVHVSTFCEVKRKIIERGNAPINGDVSSPPTPKL